MIIFLALISVSQIRCGNPHDELEGKYFATTSSATSVPPSLKSTQLTGPPLKSNLPTIKSSNPPTILTKPFSLGPSNIVTSNPLVIRTTIFPSIGPSKLPTLLPSCPTTLKPSNPTQKLSIIPTGRPSISQPSSSSKIPIMAVPLFTECSNCQSCGKNSLVTIPSNVLSVTSSAFAKCSFLQMVYIPSTITSI